MNAGFRLTKPFPRNLTLKFSSHFFHGRHINGHLFAQQMFNIQNANFSNEFPNNVSTYTFPLFPIITYAFHYALNCNLSVMDNIKNGSLANRTWQCVLDLRIKTGTTGGPLRTRNGTSSFPKMQGISWSAEEQQAFEKGLCCIGLADYICSFSVISPSSCE